MTEPQSSPPEVYLIADLMQIIRHLMGTPTAGDYTETFGAIMRAMVHYRSVLLPEYEDVINKAAIRVVERQVRDDGGTTSPDDLEIIDKLSELVVHAVPRPMRRNGR